MTTQVVSDINFTDPSNLIPYLEKDDAIVRNVTKSLVDFSNTASLPTSGALPSGTTATSLTVDAGTGISSGPFPAVSGGLIDLGGTSLAWNLPNTFKLANGCKRFLVICWVKLPSSGYQTGSANISQAIISNASNTSTLAQWFFNLTTVQATGLVANLQWGGPFNSSGATTYCNLTSGDTSTLCNGSVHQLAGYFDGENVGAGSAQGSIWMDGTQKVAGNLFTWDGSIIQPASTARFGTQTAFQQNYPTGFKVGRASMWDLTGTSWTPTQILARDSTAAAGYIS